MLKRSKDLLRTLVRELRVKLVGSLSVVEETEVRGNLDRELERLGFPPDGSIKPIETLPDAQPHETYAHQIVTAQLAHLPQEQRPAVREEIIERAAYTWINRLLALRAMEVRELIDKTLRGDELYSGMSEKLFILRETQPARAEGEDNGWWGVIEDACNELAISLPGLFALDDPAATLRPGAGVLVQCIALVGGQMDDFSPDESDAAFADPDAIGWAYQFYQEESKANIDAKCKNGGKVLNRSELAAKTQLFTEPYMVQWLLQNSLGRSYHEFFPQSTLPATWSYYVQPEKLDAPAFTLVGLTLLDPCMGSGHFLRAAFDLFVQMYHEQYPAWSMREIVDCVLSQHLFGIDLDPRAAQLTALTLYLRACELLREERRAQRLSGNDPDFRPTMNLATTPTHLNKGVLARHLKRHPDDEYFLSLIKEIFTGLEQAELLGSLLRPREYLDRAIEELKNLPAVQLELFSSPHDETLPIHIAAMAKEEPGELKKMAFKHIIESFHSEAHNVKDVSEMLFGREAEQGVRLFQLLDRQYAVVVTNPPYLGSSYMNAPLKKYVEQNYKAGKRDLYTAFILRNLQLCKLNGRVAMVTMQSWMFLRSFTNLRLANNTTNAPEEHFTGILQQTNIEGLVHLGRYAFSEIGNAVVAPVLFTLTSVQTSRSHKIWACRLNAPRPSEEQARLLLGSVKSSQSAHLVFTPDQKDFLNISETPITYWLRQEFLDLLKSSSRLKNIAEIKQGLATANDDRFLRYTWEIVNASPRWPTFTKGGGYSRWFGQNWYHVDWEFAGSRTRAFSKSVLRNVNRYFQLGWSYSLICRGSLSLRQFDIPGCIGHKGPGIYTVDQTLIAIAQSHAFAFLIRAVSPQLAFEINTLMQAPIPEKRDQRLFQLVKYAESLKKSLTATNLTERSFISIANEREQQKICCLLHGTEGIIEALVCRSYNLTNEAIQTVIEETGTPAGWYPLVANYDTLPILPDSFSLLLLPQELLDYLSNHNSITPDTKELARIKANLRTLYEAGPGAKNVEQEESHEDVEDEEDEEQVTSGGHIPIPTETFLEELSVKMQLHPISVYWLLEELSAEGVRCKSEEQRLLEDRLSVLVLRIMGHRWPKQIEAGEEMPEWTVRSGVVPLLGGTGKKTLGNRLRERLRAEDGVLGAQHSEALLQELTGFDIDEWLRRRFFPRHISQFKSRPVVWHLVSTPPKGTNKGKKSRGGLQRRPAFECMVYYHACSTNALARVRSELLEPMIQLELGQLAPITLQLPGNQPTDSSPQGQDELAVQLELSEAEPATAQGQEQQTSLRDDAYLAAVLASERIRELRTFLDTLYAIEQRGFACEELSTLLAREPLDCWSGTGLVPPADRDALTRAEEAWRVDINDGVRVNIAPLQLAGVLGSDVLKAQEARKAVADRTRWRADERRWVREGKLPRCGWMSEQVPASPQWNDLEFQRLAEQRKLEQKQMDFQTSQSENETRDSAEEGNSYERESPATHL